jgi:hypothetical protein
MASCSCARAQQQERDAQFTNEAVTETARPMPISSSGFGLIRLIPYHQVVAGVDDPGFRKFVSGNLRALQKMSFKPDSFQHILQLPARDTPMKKPALFSMACAFCLAFFLVADDGKGSGISTLSVNVL